MQAAQIARIFRLADAKRDLPELRSTEHMKALEGLHSSEVAAGHHLCGAKAHSRGDLDWCHLTHPDR